MNGKRFARVKVKQECGYRTTEPTWPWRPSGIFATWKLLKASISGSEIMDTSLNKARDMNTDIYGFGEMVSKKYPSEWEGMKDRWDEHLRVAA